MNTLDTITERQLADGIRVHENKVAKWRDQGQIIKHVDEGGCIAYVVDRVDEWLASRCRFVPVDERPTIYGLLFHRIKLLRTSEVLRIINEHRSMCESALRVRRDVDAWPVLVTPSGEYRYFMEHINTLAQPIEPIATYTALEVQHILGLSNSEVFKLVHRGLLQVLPCKGGTPRSITKSSVIDLLRQWLPEGRNPYMWLNARIKTKYSLFSPNHIAKLLDTTPLRVRRLAVSQQVPSLLILGRERRIPADAIPLISALLDKRRGPARTSC